MNDIKPPQDPKPHFPALREGAIALLNWAGHWLFEAAERIPFLNNAIGVVGLFAAASIACAFFFGDFEKAIRSGTTILGLTVVLRLISTMKMNPVKISPNIYVHVILCVCVGMFAVPAVMAMVPENWKKSDTSKSVGNAPSEDVENSNEKPHVPASTTPDLQSKSDEESKNTGLHRGDAEESKTASSPPETPAKVIPQPNATDVSTLPTSANSESAVRANGESLSRSDFSSALTGLQSAIEEIIVLREKIERTPMLWRRYVIGMNAVVSMNLKQSLNTDLGDNIDKKCSTENEFKCEAEFVETNLLGYLRSIESALVSKKNEIRGQQGLEGVSPEAVIDEVIKSQGHVQPFACHVMGDLGVMLEYANRYGEPECFIVDDGFGTVPINGYVLKRPNAEGRKFTLHIHGADLKRREVDHANRFMTQYTGYELRVDVAKLIPQLKSTDANIEVRFGDESICLIKLNFGNPPISIPTPSPLPPDEEGYVINVPGNRVKYLYQYTGRPNEVTFVVRRIRKNMGYKETGIKNDSGDIGKARTEGEDDGTEFTLIAGQLTGNLRIFFGKSGFAGAWKGVIETPITKEALLGKRITYTTIED